MIHTLILVRARSSARLSVFAIAAAPIGSQESVLKAKKIVSPVRPEAGLIPETDSIQRFAHRLLMTEAALDSPRKRAGERLRDCEVSLGAGVGELTIV